MSRVPDPFSPPQRRGQPSGNSVGRRNETNPFRPTATPKKSSGGNSDDQAISQSLRRTQGLLSQEIERTQLVSNAIHQDGSLIGKTKSHHSEIKDDIYGAKGALTGLEREKQKERLILVAAVVFFYLSALYVLWTRIRIPFLLW